MHWADSMRVVLHQTDYNSTIVLGPSEGGRGGQDTPDGLGVSGRNRNWFGANAFVADRGESYTITGY